MMQNECRALTEDMVRAWLPTRPENGHKGTFGHLLSVCGCRGMAGAAAFAAEAAYRCGAGLVTAAMPRGIYPLLTVQVPEAVCALLPEEENGGIAAAAKEILLPLLSKMSAVLIGCGLGKGDGTASVLSELLKTAACPIVVDADGLNLLAAHKNEMETGNNVCLTPHPAEAARLLGITTEAVEADRQTAAKTLAERYHAVVVLKGHETLIAAEGMPLLQNHTGNDGLAKGGSGDVLAGMIGGLAAGGMPLYEAAACGVYLHGLAGERAAKRLSRRGMLPRDVLTELSFLLSDYE